MGDEEERRTTRSLAGLAMALALVVIGFFLSLKLTEAARIEDCLLSGRRDCAPIESASDSNRRSVP
ncbi:MAG: hypothetical protein QOJ54_259 [Aliidongia sp.]|jgi:hypothetical protein|nr:hypothetical protein [Aliidongia sp.]